MKTRFKRALSLTIPLVILSSSAAVAQEQTPVDPPSGPVYVSEPVVPTITRAVRDLPDWTPDLDLYGLEMKRRDDFGFIPIEYPIKPQVDPLLALQQLEGPRLPDSFWTVVHNYAGQTSTSSPPDTNGDRCGRACAGRGGLVPGPRTQRLREWDIRRRLSARARFPRCRDRGFVERVSLRHRPAGLTPPQFERAIRP